MPLTVCTTVSNPRRSAHGPTRPKAESDTYTMPGPQPRQVFRRQPPAGQGSGAITLRENVRFLDQSLQVVHVGRLPQVQVGRNSLPCPVSSSCAPLLGRWLAVIFNTSAPCSAMVAGAGWPGQHAGQVQDAGHLTAGAGRRAMVPAGCRQSGQSPAAAREATAAD